MKNQTKILLAAITSVFGLSVAHADPEYREINTYDYYEINKTIVYRNYGNCVREYRTALSVERLQTQACHQVEEQRLDWIDEHYPQLRHNPRRVRFWTGAFAKTMADRYQILRELVDVCRGKIVSSQTIPVTRERAPQVYRVQNPNLSNQISESYMLVPMTKAEAKEAMDKALEQCQKN